MTSIASQHTLRNLQENDLQRLASAPDGFCVSILMPTHRKGRETQQDPIRLKNLLSEASEKLQDAGEDDGILSSANELLQNSTFWQHQGEGLAIFLTKDQCHLLRLNRQVDEIVWMDKSFFIAPLIREHNAQGRYFVLALSWDEATLYQCDGETLTVTETDLLPAKFDALVLPRDPEESLQNTSHRSVGNAGGSSVAMYHGQGEGEQKVEADRDQYLSIVGSEVSASTYNTGMPLVVIATSEVAGHFGATNEVEIDRKVDGSPSAMSEDEMRRLAHDAIAPVLEADRERLKERFGTAMANSQASQNPDEIIKAAKNGTVDTLMVGERNSFQTNRAVIETLRTGGKVVRCRAKSMPTMDAKIAAIFRF